MEAPSSPDQPTVVASDPFDGAAPVEYAPFPSDPQIPDKFEPEPDHEIQVILARIAASAHMAEILLRAEAADPGHARQLARQLALEVCAQSPLLAERLGAYAAGECTTLEIPLTAADLRNEVRAQD